MKTTMDTTHVPTIEQMLAYVSSEGAVSLQWGSKEETYTYIERVCERHRYQRLGRKDKGCVRAFLGAVTGYSEAQLDRLIGQYVRVGAVKRAVRTQPTFHRVYTAEDIAELARIDELYDGLSGPATCAVLRREYELFGNQACIRLAHLSPAQLYRFRDGETYRSIRMHYTKTRPTKTPLGTRRKPQPNGVPGFIRVDTVHQGDRDGQKGVYHVNLVDEVTQWEVVVAVEKISERFMLPALEAALDLFPFTIHNFHADNGSEYINYQVARLLEGMVVKLTKSRPRHSGDNGLVETKNGAIIRKALGYLHIPQSPDNVASINRWHTGWFVPWLNFHRPCAHRVVLIDETTGKRQYRYPAEGYMTPYQKLLSLPHPAQYLKTDQSLEQLEAQAYTMSDSEWTHAMQTQKQAMWNELRFTS